MLRWYICSYYSCERMKFIQRILIVSCKSAYTVWCSDYICDLNDFNILTLYVKRNLNRICLTRGKE